MGNCFQGIIGGGNPASKKGFKVCVCGGAGGIGMPLCLLMAMDPRVSELAVYDLTIAMVPSEGVAADLSHVEGRCKVKAYSLDTSQKPIDHLRECLTGCSLVLVPAGVPRKPNQVMSELLKINAGIAKAIVEACARFCPNAVVGLIVNPVNSVVPAMAKLYEKRGLDPMKICGITTLDSVRANKFVQEELDALEIANPTDKINVPVMGGHAGKTILPLFSQDPAARKISEERLKQMDQRVQEAGIEVEAARKGKGGPTLSMAYAGARFARAVLAGLSGESAVDYAYVKTSVCSGVSFFSSKVQFGRNGVEKVLPLPDQSSLSAHERSRLKEVVASMQVDIDNGLKYADANDLAVPRD